MSNLVKLNVISGDKMFYIDWENVALTGLGEYTTKVVVTVNNTNIQLDNSDNHTLQYNYPSTENPSIGNATIDGLIYGQTYIVSVTQYYKNAAKKIFSYGTGANAVTIAVGSSPDPIELKSNDTSYTVNDLTYIIVKTHFPLTYSDGGQPITSITFLATYVDQITKKGTDFSFSFDKTDDGLYKLDGLLENKTFEIVANAWNDVGGSDPSNTIIENTSGYPKSPEPFNITTSYSISSDETKVLLAWTPPINANLTDLLGYKINYRLSSGISYTTIDVKGRTTVDGTVDGTIDGTLIQNMSYEFLNSSFPDDSKTYDFNIVSYNNLDISLTPFSPAVGQAYIFKNALQLQNVISLPGDSSLHLTWDVPTILSLRGYPLEKYVINVYTGDSATGLFNTYNTTNKYFDIDELTNGQKMCVVIFAQTKNSVTGDIIDGASVTMVSTVLNNMETTPFTNPTVPLVLSVVPRNGDIRLDWSPPSFDGGFSISKYFVSHKLHTETDYANVNIVDVGNEAFYIIPGLTNGVSYDVELYAVNSATSTTTYSTNKGTKYSESIIKPYNSSNAITGLEIIPSHETLSCSWDAPSNTGGFAIDHYKVYLNNETTYQTTVTTSILLEQLTNGVSYEVTIVPYTYIEYLQDNLMGTLYKSSGYYPYKVFDAVTGLIASPNNGFVSLSWNAAESGNTEFPIHHYTVSYNETTISVNEITTKIYVPNGEVITYTVTPVTLNMNPGAGNSELFGTSAAVTSRAYTKPEPITNLRVIPSDSRIKLLFVPSSNNGGYDITYYKISYKVVSSEYTEILLDASNLPRENSDIVYSFIAVNGSGYDIKISVINAAATNNTSIEEISEKQIPYRASNGVTILPVSASDTKLYASWQLPSDNGGFAIVEYKLYLDYEYIATTSSLNYLFEELVNGQSYVISIIPVTFPDYTSVKLDGAEAFASSIKPYTTPDPVINLAVVNKDKELVLSWTPPVDSGVVRGDGGNNIVGYSVKIVENAVELFSADIANVLTYTFNVTNVPTIANGNTYTLKCKALTKTVANAQLESVDAEIPAKPYGKPLEIIYSIDILTNIITINVNNNGSHLSGILIVAPVSTDSANNDLAHILAQNTLGNDIEEQIEYPLYDKFSVEMNYQLAEKALQAMLIVVTNSAGMNFVQNFSTIA
jgi:hypothetical protein